MCDYDDQCTKPADTTVGMMGSETTAKMCRAHAEDCCKADPYTYIVEA